MKRDTDAAAELLAACNRLSAACERADADNQSLAAALGRLADATGGAVPERDVRRLAVRLRSFASEVLAVGGNARMLAADVGALAAEAKKGR